MRNGVRLGVDVGSVRVGVARSDASGMIAVPVATLARDTQRRSDLDALSSLVSEHSAVEVVIGLPRSLSGQEGAAARAARAYAVAVARRVAPVPVRLVDERLSTVTATRSLRDAGVKGRRHRPVVDQAAAVVILQSALDAERASGRAPGSLVEPGPASGGPARGAEEAGQA